jgi:hypothetical protein
VIKTRPRRDVLEQPVAAGVGARAVDDEIRGQPLAIAAKVGVDI